MRSLFYSRWARTQVTFFLAAVARQCAKAAAKRGSKRVARAPVRQQSFYELCAISRRVGPAAAIQLYVHAALVRLSLDAVLS